jgi:ferredoxin
MKQSFTRNQEKMKVLSDHNEQNTIFGKKQPRLDKENRISSRLVISSVKNLKIKPIVRWLSLFLAIAFALPLSWKGYTGMYTWLSPFIMLNSIFVLKSLVWLNILGFGVLLISFFRKRWFCRHLCPVGMSCDIVSRMGWRKNFSSSRIPDIKRYLVWISLAAALLGFPIFILLDPMAIFNGFFSIFSENFSLVVLLSFSGLPLLLVSQVFFPKLWCNKICPLGGLQEELSRIRRMADKLKPKPILINPLKNEVGRRFFIASGAGAISGMLMGNVMNPVKAEYLRPPGAVSAGLFNVLCIRCGNCIKSCPTNVIVHHKDFANLTAWMTPEISYQNNGYCLEDCNLCGRVCPSGSITLFDVNAKKKLKIGTSLVHPDECLLTTLKECDRCKATCTYNAIDIVPFNQVGQMIPVVDKDLCVGCGACAAICPPQTIEVTIKSI